MSSLDTNYNENPLPSSELADQVIGLKNRCLDSGWLRIISDVEPETNLDNSSNSQLRIRLNHPISPSNEACATRRMAKALLPAMIAHSKTTDAQVALNIQLDSPVESLPVETHIAQAFQIDFTGLLRETKKRLSDFGITATRLSIYNIQLGQSLCTIVTLHFNTTNVNWEVLIQCKEELEQRFDINIRFEDKNHHNRQHKLLYPANLDLERLLELKKTYDSMVLLPPVSPQFLDWRHLDFFSIDPPKTYRPEDIFNLSIDSEGLLVMRTALPIGVNGYKFFQVFKDQPCIGLEQKFDSNGTLVSEHIQLAVTHNSFQLSSSQAHQVMKSSSSPDRCHVELANQLTLLNQFAGGILMQSLLAGESKLIEVEMNDSTYVDLPETILSYLVGRFSKLAQHTLANWFLNSGSDSSLIVVRNPELIADNFQNFDETKARNQNLTLIRAPEVIFPTDKVKLKPVKSLVGSVNNIQVISALLGINGLSTESLTELVNSFEYFSKVTTRTWPDEFRAKAEEIVLTLDRMQ